MTFARVLGLETRRVQFTSDTMPSDIIGFSVYDKDTGKLVYKPGAVMTSRRWPTSIYRVPPAKRSPRFWRRWKRAMSASTAKRIRCQTRLSSLRRRTPPAPPVRRCCRTAQLDRFLVKLTMGYPDFKSQVSILEERHGKTRLTASTPSSARRN